MKVWKVKRKSVIDKLIAYHVARAKGGNGLNTVEVTAVDKASVHFGFLFLAEDKYTNGLKKSNDTSDYEKLDISTHIIGDCKKANVALMRLEMHIMQY